MENRKPLFYDLTLREGTQVLKHSWNIEQKECVFLQLLKLGVQVIEIGFSGSNEADFEACRHLASIAPPEVIVSGLARAKEQDILMIAEALKKASRTRIHVFISFSPFHMRNVLKKTPEEVRKTAVEAVDFARGLLGENQEVQFSVEHFGDCAENLPFVIDALQDVVAAGATIINLSNTVERTRPLQFVGMMKTVFENLPGVTPSVYCHNDLGMGTATAVESFFAGASQLECSLNGLGNPTGSASLCDVAMSLYNCGVQVPLDMSALYETARMLAGTERLPLHDERTLPGYDRPVSRGRIHQDGTGKACGKGKGAVRSVAPSLMGGGGVGHPVFTSQSGKMAIYDMIRQAGYAITVEDALRIFPAARKKADEMGGLPLKYLLNLYISESMKSR